MYCIYIGIDVECMNTQHLSFRYELTGGEIAKVLCSAAEEVATETTGPTQLTQGHLMRAAEAVISHREQFFDHQLSIFR